MSIFMPFGGTVEPAAETNVTSTSIFGAPAAFSDYTHSNGRLLINGVEVPITGFSFNKPNDGLGGLLKVQLAFSRQALPEDGVYTFDLMFKRGGVWQPETILAGGLLNGSEYRISFVEDSLSFDAMDYLADRWNKAPDEVPITIYDPEKVDPDSTEVTPDTLTDEDGVAIVPDQQPIPGLSLHRALHEAYVAGMGFDEVETNLPDDPISRADFTLEGGYQGGVAALIGMFRPRYSLRGNTIGIWWPGEQMPGGYAAKLVDINDHYVDLGETVPANERTSALRLIYQTSGGDSSRVVTIILPPTTNSANPLDPNYTTSQISLTKREYYDAAAPAVVLSDEILQTKVETYTGGWLVEENIMTEIFDGMGRKIKSTTAIRKRLPDEDGDPSLMNAMDKTVTIVYGADPTNPRQSIIISQVTDTNGLILIDNDREYLGQPGKMPYEMEHRNENFDPSGNFDLDYGPLTTNSERAFMRGGRVLVCVQTTDHLKGITDTEWVDRVGSVTIPRRRQFTRTTLLRVPGGAVGRRAAELNTGEVPATLAKRLGWQELNRRNKPPRRLQLTLGKVDLTIDRGTIIAPNGREGALRGKFIVDGLTITGSNLGTETQDITMVVTAEEMPADV